MYLVNITKINQISCKYPQKLPIKYYRTIKKYYQLIIILTNKMGTFHNIKLYCQIIQITHDTKEHDLLRKNWERFRLKNVLLLSIFDQG